MGDTNGRVFSLESAYRVIVGTLGAVQFGDSAQVDALGDWLANNFYASGRITATQREGADMNEAGTYTTPDGVIATLIGDRLVSRSMRHSTKNSNAAVTYPLQHAA